MMRGRSGRWKVWKGSVLLIDNQMDINDIICYMLLENFISDDSFTQQSSVNK